MPAQKSTDNVNRISLQGLLALQKDAQALTLKPKQIRSIQSGGYLSPFRGRGMEFDETRPYMPGDDVRMFDWRVTARTGKPHTKLFREERERAVLLCCDLRNHMHFATRGAFKSVRAAQYTALFGWTALKHGDRLGGLVFSDHSHSERRPKRGKQALMQIFRELNKHPGWETDSSGKKESLTAVFKRLVYVTHPGSLIIISSDFYDLTEAHMPLLAQLTQHNDVLFIALYDPFDAQLPPPGSYLLRSGDKIQQINTASKRFRKDYQAAFDKAQQQLTSICNRLSIDLIPVSTADDPPTTLQGLFGKGR